MKRRKPVPGYIEAQEELQVAIIYGGRESRQLMNNLRELKRQLRNCNHPGAAANMDTYLMEYLRKDMAANLQRLTRHANAARRAVVTFLEVNRLE